MKTLMAKVVPLVLATGLLAPSVQAAEPALADILQGVEATSWTQISYDDFIGGSWNQVWQQLTFTFVAEHTAHSATQEFWLDAAFTPDPYGYVRDLCGRRCARRDLNGYPRKRRQPDSLQLQHQC